MNFFSLFNFSVLEFGLEGTSDGRDNETDDGQTSYGLFIFFAVILSTYLHVTLTFVDLCKSSTHLYEEPTTFFPRHVGTWVLT